MGRLEDILENIDAAKEFSAGLTFEQFRTNREKRYAIIRALEIVSEAARHIPEAVRDRHRHVPWRQINAAGNVYRHEYKGVDEDTVWDTVQN